MVPHAAGVEVAAVQRDSGEREREVQGVALGHEAPVREHVRVAGLEHLRARSALAQVAHGDVAGVFDVRLDHCIALKAPWGLHVVAPRAGEEIRPV